MPCCEKCWSDSGGIAEKYNQLVDQRRNNPCTGEQQAGENAGLCEHCNRKTVHQYAGACMICGE